MVAVLCAGLALAAGSALSSVAAALLLAAIVAAHRANLAGMRTGKTPSS
jgi:hypothetical protein